MAAGIVWHDTTKKVNENDSPLKSQDLDARHRMYQNQQSSIFGGGYVDKQPIMFTSDQARTAIGSAANWHT
jgi:hypothetical protein